MGTIYNIPVTWTRVAGRKEIYDGTMSIPNILGNVINAKFVNCSGSGYVYNDGMTQYWNYMDVIADIMQGSNKYTSKYYSSGKYYPDRTYSYNIDLSAIVFNVSDNYSIRVTDNQSMFAQSTMTRPSTLQLDVTSLTVEKPINFTHIGNEIFNNITVKYEMTSTNKVDYQVIQDGSVLIDKVNYTGTQFTIPYGTLKTTSSVTVKVRTHFNFLGTEQYSDWVTYSISSLKALTAARPTNLRLVGTTKSIEEDMPFAWDITETDNYLWRFEVWQDGIKVYAISTYTGAAKIPANKLKSTNNITVMVNATKTLNGYTNTSDYASLNVSGIISIKPIINDFTLDGNNTDYNITIIPNVTGVTYYEWKVGTIKEAGTTITKGVLKEGTNSITLIAYKVTQAGYVAKSELTKIFEITKNRPIIYSLEPNNINVNITQPSTISFALNSFIDGWELLVNNTLYTSGAKETSVPIPANVFKKGTNNLQLKAWYSPAYNLTDVRNTVTTVSFTGYGKPTLPTLDTSTVYNTATPIFTWILGSEYGDEQTAFEIKLAKKTTLEVVETKIIVGTTTSYTVATALENNTEYRVSVSIKNKYEVWSDWATKDIITNFNNLPIPTLALSSTDTSITIKVDALQPTDFKEVKIYRSDDINQAWTCIANNLNNDETIVDYVPQPNVTNYYKARLYDISGGYSESIIYKTYFDIQYYNLVSVLGFGNNLQLKSAIASFAPVTNTVKKVFANSIKPTIFKSRTKYVTGTMNCTLTNLQLHSLEKFINEGELFCYRDWRGRKLYCFAEIANIDYSEAGLNEVSLTITEINFKEDNMFSGRGYKKIVYLNGEYMLDGSIDMSGYDVNFERVVVYNAELR